jgi:hypothetical protein
MDVRFRDVPPELVEWLNAEAKGRGLSTRAFVVAGWWQLKDGLERGPERGPKRGAKRHTFTPPTEEEAGTEYKTKGYHFELQAFMAHYSSVGWKVGKNTMTSWQAAMVGWESRWKEKQAGIAPAKPKVKYVRVDERPPLLGGGEQ